MAVVGRRTTMMAPYWVATSDASRRAHNDMRVCHPDEVHVLRTTASKHRAGSSPAAVYVDAWVRANLPRPSPRTKQDSLYESYAAQLEQTEAWWQSLHTQYVEGIAQRLCQWEKQIRSSCAEMQRPRMEKPFSEIW